jgi:ribonuclease HI
MSNDSSVLIYCDGGSRRNGTSLQSAYGSFLVNIWDKSERVSLEFGVRTNNEAEYLTLIAALRYCLDLGLRRPEIRLDSALVYGQVVGFWRCRASHLLPLIDEARRLVEQVGAHLLLVSRDEVSAFLGH